MGKKSDKKKNDSKKKGSKKAVVAATIDKPVPAEEWAPAPGDVAFAKGASKKEAKAADARHTAHLARVADLHSIVADAEVLLLPDSGSKKKVRAAAEEAKAAAEEELQKYRDETAARMADPKAVDRSDVDAVAAFNEAEAARPGHTALITSDAEIAKELERVGGKKDTALHTGDAVVDDVKARLAAKKAARAEAASKESAEWEAAKEEQSAEESAAAAAEKERLAALTPAERRAENRAKKLAAEKTAEGLKDATAFLDESSDEVEAEVVDFERAKEHVAEVVETEKGREFAVGPDAGPEVEVDTLDDFAAVKPEQPRDGMGRPKVLHPTTGKLTAYTRMTTFIDCLDDKTALTNWGRRIVVAGIAVVEQRVGGEDGFIGADDVAPESILARVEEANRLLVAGKKKVAKSVRKGQLDADGESAALAEIDRAYKAVLDVLAVEAFDAGDGFTKAATGTRLHMLSEYIDRKEPLPDDVTPSEVRDMDAYRAALKSLNIEVKAIEKFVVLDDEKVAGTMDRIVRYDSPSLGRRITAVGDLKTGRIDFGGGKIARQLAGYAKGKGYDFEQPEERELLRLNKAVGLVFHLPAGSGVCTVYEVDLAVGADGLKLCGLVRAHRTASTTKKLFAEIKSAE